MVPAWRALPLWAKILLFPVLIWASLRILLMICYMLIGLGTLILAGMEVAYETKGKVVNAA